MNSSSNHLKQHSFIAALLVSCVVSLCFAQASYARSSCIGLFPQVDPKKQRVLDWISVQNEINQKLGFETKLRTRTSDGLVQIVAEKINGYPAIELTFDYWPQRKILTIEYIVTDPYIKRGLAHSLIKASFVLFPDVDVIQVPSLVLDNENQLNDSLGKGLTQEHALMQTPIYKVLAQFGFSEIIPRTMNSEGGFAVRRPRD